MILQALTQLYEDLKARGEISPPGWSKTKVGFALCLDSNGNVDQIIPLAQEVQVGKKMVSVNREMILPMPVKRAVNVESNFLWDNSGYIFGIDAKGNPKRSVECFTACSRLHHLILGEIQNDCAKAILRFFEKWVPKRADEVATFFEIKEEIVKGSNIVFRVNGQFAHENYEISEAWQQYYDKAKGELIQCLITGERDILERLHPSIKGVSGAQSSGASLVSFNADAFCSFGREQGANAPVGKKASFAYTTALNHLLSDRDNVQHVGDTTVVCWSKGAEKQYNQFSLACLWGENPLEGMTEEDLRSAVKRLAEGKPCDEYGLSPDTEFYILGLAPNAARLSVRFFFRSSFGELMKNVNAHHERLRIEGNRYSFIPLWALLRETANQKSKDKSPSPVLAGSVARSVFSGSLYPAGLLEAVMLRIRAEREIKPNRAAIIKAYYLRNQNPSCPKEVLTVSLNENSTNIPYTIGRLFAVYEAAQEKANPGINATIKDKYFNSAASTPAHVLPVLNSLYQKHLRKMSKGMQVFFEKQVGDLMTIIGDSLPTRLSLPEQGAFQLGYYHQYQQRFTKSNGKENDTQEDN